VEPGAPLPPARAARFARHVTLPGVGAEGQRRIANARILVIGAGGLGAPTIQYLAAAGVGRLTIVDDDVVERTNLQRQVLHREEDLGRPKAESARDAVRRLDAAIDARAIVDRLSPDNALDLFADHDLVLDGTDNFATRYLSNDAAELTGTPLVWGTILRFEGHASVFWPGRGPMLRDVFPDIPDADSMPSCAEGGVFGVLCGSIGSAMATEALKLVCGIGKPLVGRLLRYDALEAAWSELRFAADPDREPVSSLEEVAVACRAAAAPKGARPDDISAAEVAARLAAATDAESFSADADQEARSGLIVVDVREGWEREIASIPGSRHVPLARVLEEGWLAIERELGSLAVDGRDVVVACQAGVRSARAIDALAASAPASASLRNLAGGVDAWRTEVFK